MPNTATTDIEVAQRAMVLVGLEPLTSFTDGTDEALVANTVYEDLVEDCIAQHNWNFATGQKTLARLTDTPVDIWDAAYALLTSPAVLQINTVTIDDTPQPYDVYERYIYMNASENDTVVLNYMFRVDTQYWPPTFTSVGYLSLGRHVGFVGDTKGRHVTTAMYSLLLSSSVVPRQGTASK